MHTGIRGGRRLAAIAFCCAASLAGASSSTAAVPVGPTATSGPIVIGVAAAGKRLTGLSGVWTGTGAIHYRFQWFRCNAAGADCYSILGATTSAFTLGSLDVGKTVGLTVYASDSTGTAAGYASLVGPIATARPPLVATAQPVVTGVPAVGRTLKVSTGTWSPMVARFTYAWEQCNAEGRVCAPIAGAARSSYLVAASDLGHALVALVQATNAATLQNAFSAATPAVVAPSVRGPVALTPPLIEGTAVAGSQLIAATGRWQGVGSVGFAFRWQVCSPYGTDCIAVGDATTAAVRPQAADAGKTIALTLRVTDLTGTTTAYASLVGPIAGPQAPLVATTMPAIAGVPTVGSTLTVDPGSWSSPPTTYAYAWLRCNLVGRFCTPIAGAATSTYRLTTSDSAHTLVAEVSAKAGTSTQAALSPASPAIG